MAKVEVWNELNDLRVDLNVTEEGTTISINYYCGTSKELTIPSTIGGIPVTAINNYAISSSDELTNIIISEGIISIGDCGFSNCENLNNIILPESITSIGDEAFRNCELLTSIKFPKNIVKIGDNAFKGCSKLTEFIVDVNNPAFTTNEGVLFDKKMTTLIKCPVGKKGEYTVPDSVVNIEDTAFHGCKDLKQITITSNVFCIDAIRDCEQLTDIIVHEKNLEFTSIEGVLFDKKSHVLFQYPRGRNNMEYTVPKGTIRIFDSAFLGCKKLININLPEDLLSIEDCAFDECEQLASLVLPTNLKHIGNYTFRNCPNLKSISLSRNTKFGYKAFDGFSGQLIYRD